MGLKHARTRSRWIGQCFDSNDAHINVCNIGYADVVNKFKSKMPEQVRKEKKFKNKVNQFGRSEERENFGPAASAATKNSNQINKKIK